MNKCLTLLFSLVMLFSSIEARWLSLSDAPQKVNTEINVHIDAQGNFVNETKKTIDILNERGRDADFRFYYNPDCEEFKIVKSLVKKRDGHVVELSDKFIENKPLASSGHGFDQINQIYLAFPNLEIGDKIELVTKLERKKNLLNDYFAQIFKFGYFNFEQKSKVTIRSQLPLKFKINDPLHCLKVEQKMDTKNKEQVLVFELRKPLYQSVGQEIGYTIVDENYFTWVSVSSVDSWQILGNKYYQNLFVKKQAEDLPKVFQDIAVLAQDQHGEINQINAVTSLLNEKVRYLGDWRSIKGRYVPHDLLEIAKHRVGDCKDFARVTQAILQKMGYQVNLVLVHRGLYNSSFEYCLPDLGAFNHMMVKVIAPSGKGYWIDPTNFVSMAGFIFPDIACKWGLVLGEESVYEQIPSVDYRSALVSFQRELDLRGRDIWEKGLLNLKNEAAFSLTGAELQYSPETIAEWFYTSISNNGVESNARKHFKVSPLKSRIVDQVNFDYQIVRSNELINTNVGDGIKLQCPEILQAILNIQSGDVSKKMLDLFPCTVYRKTVIKNVKAPNFEILNQKLNNRWLKIERSGKMDGDDLHINEVIELYHNVIDVKDFDNTELKIMKNWIQQNYSNSVLVIEKANKSKNTYLNISEKIISAKDK